MTQPSAGFRPSDRFIPWYFVLFFAVIALVDGIMVTLALRTHTGIVTDHPYEKGLAYNAVVEQETRQEALGWQGNLTLEGNVLSFSLRDAKGVAISADRVRADITRPTQAGMDFSAPLSQSAEGAWQAALAFPEAGLWEVRVFAEHGENRYQQARRFVVPQP